jgi:hypothetical protein
MRLVFLLYYNTFFGIFRFALDEIKSWYKHAVTCRELGGNECDFLRSWILFRIKMEKI